MGEHEFEKWEYNGQDEYGEEHAKADAEF